MPHIALFLPDLHAGGAERVMLQLADAFAGRGHRVDLVLARADGALLDRVPPGVTLVDLDARSPIPGRIGLGLASVRALSSYIRSKRPNSLLSTLTGANLVAGLAIKRATGSETRWVAREACSTRNLRRWAYRVLIRPVYSNADYIVTVSRDLKDEMVSSLGLPADLIRAIPNPVDAERLQKRAESIPDHPWYTDREKPIVTACGRLEKQKGFEDLIRAVAHVQSVRASRLLILGEGSQRNRLEALVSALSLEESVQLPGFVMDTAPYVRHSDLFVLASHWEGFPNVLVEALALGVPVVATDCETGPREILDYGRYGTLCEVGDEKELANAISSALKTPVDTKLLTQRASLFDPAGIAMAYERRLIDYNSRTS